MKHPSHVTITWDASPWGMGGTLHVNGELVAFYADVPHTFEVELLQIEIGLSSAQQILECLGGLIALRLWKRWWHSSKALLKIRSDNVGALTLLGRLGTHSPANSLIAREAALDLADSSFAPYISEHISGVSNMLSDALSRLQQPGHPEARAQVAHTSPRPELVEIALSAAHGISSRGESCEIEGSAVSCVYRVLFCGDWQRKELKEPTWGRPESLFRGWILCVD